MARPDAPPELGLALSQARAVRVRSHLLGLLANCPAWEDEHAIDRGVRHLWEFLSDPIFFTLFLVCHMYMSYILYLHIDSDSIFWCIVYFVAQPTTHLTKTYGFEHKCRFGTQVPVAMMRAKKLKMRLLFTAASVGLGNASEPLAIGRDVHLVPACCATALGSVLR